MTNAKRPLPSLRFIVFAEQTIELIPLTDKKGRVTPGYWAVPGGDIRTTKQLSDHCKRKGFRHCITGTDGVRRREWL